MKLRTGLNPYGLTYYLGMQGRGTPRANPTGGVGLEGFIKLTEEYGGKVIELADGWLKELDETGLKALRARLEKSDITPVVSSGLQHGDVDACIGYAKALGATVMRFALTPILRGERAAAGQKWHDLVKSTHEKLAAAAPKAAAANLTLLIENHQDFTSRELVGFCEEYGPSVRIVYDTANSFPVAESPLDFTRVVAPYVRYCHAKDYRVQFTDEGIRLVRCPTGDGAVPFKELFAILGEHNETMLAAIEIGALEARHVKLLTPDWWHGYAPKQAEELAACLLAARTNRIGDDEEWRTPWEREADHELVDYELGQMKKSVANMKSLGLM
jgi:sugar phosphate isomerase/epimerase